MNRRQRKRKALAALIHAQQNPSSPEGRALADARFEWHIERRLRRNWRGRGLLRWIRRVLTHRRYRGQRLDLLRLVAALLDGAPALTNPTRLHRLLWYLPYAPWVRDPAGFAATSRDPQRQLEELTEHLLVRYPVPRFLVGMFTDANRPHHAIGAALFAHLTRGGSMRQAVRDRLLPVPLNRRMCHALANYEADDPIVTAVRNVQLDYGGASLALRTAIHASALGRRFDTFEPLWAEVIAWLCRQDQAQLQVAHVGPILDWIRCVHLDARREGHELDLSEMTLPAVLRALDRWHAQLGRRPLPNHVAVFEPSGFAGFIGVDEHGQQRQIIELLGSHELLDEGRALRHCVASYTSAAASGQVSLWSLRIDQLRQLTIEVRMGEREVVQVRGYANRLPTEHEMGIIRRWAADNGIRIARWLPVDSRRAR